METWSTTTVEIGVELWMMVIMATYHTMLQLQHQQHPDTLTRPSLKRRNPPAVVISAAPSAHDPNLHIKHLAQMASYSATTPLRVIAHVDLDAFYAQCEQVRLGLPADTPLAVQQWGGLIAINYPARACGLTRFINLADARRLCPELVCQHVATWKEGESGWAYRDNAALNMGTQKVSLDPYRAQSRRILACIKNTLAPGKLQRVEKASVDEVFMDLSAQVHEELLKRYPEELKGPPPYDDPTESLPRPPTTALNWQTDALVDLDGDETEEDDPDWDDIVMLIASEIVRDVRAAVREEVQYTCSAGIARNKMLAKLGSGYNKPNRQTVIRNRAIAHFMYDMKFTKIRNLGGKLGDEIVAAFGTDGVKELLNVSLEQLRRQLGDDTGTWLYQIVRGEDDSEVTARTQIKSMLSAKSFRPTISSIEVARRWLRIFVADIFSRLVDDGLLEKRRRPRTLNLHHRQVSQMRSRQAPIPVGRPLDEGVLFEIAKTLLVQVVADGRAWPCSNLSLSVGGFEEVAVAGNRGIGGFLVRGEEAAALAKGGGGDSTTSNRKDKEEKWENEAGDEFPSLPPPDKRRRTTSGGHSNGGAGNQQSSGIARFFSASREASRGDDDDDPDVEMGGEGRIGWESDGRMLRHRDNLDSLDGNEGIKQRYRNTPRFAESRSSSSLKRKSSDLEEDNDERSNPDYDLEPDKPNPFNNNKDNNTNINNDTANKCTNTDRKSSTNDSSNTRRKTTTNNHNNHNTNLDDPWSTPPSAQPPPRQDTSSFEKQSSSSPPTKTVTKTPKPAENAKLKSSTSTTTTTVDMMNKRNPATLENPNANPNPRPRQRPRSSAGRPLQPSTSTLNKSKTYFDGKPLLRDATAVKTAKADRSTDCCYC